jgi:hypothetical protein
MPDHSEVEVLNAKGKKALTIPFDEYLLDTGDLLLDTNNPHTYSLLCYAGPILITSKIEEAQKLYIFKTTDTGLFSLSWDPDDPKLICISNLDQTTFSFNLSETLRPQDEEWIPVGQRGAASLKHLITFNQVRGKGDTTTNSSSHNRFSPLANDDDVVNPSTKSDTRQGVHFNASNTSNGSTHHTNNNRRDMCATPPPKGNDSANSDEAVGNEGESPSPSQSGDNENQNSTG